MKKGKYRNIFTGANVTLTSVENLPFGNDFEEFAHYEREEEQFTYEEDRETKIFIGKKFIKPTRIFIKCYIKVDDEANR